MGRSSQRGALLCAGVQGPAGTGASGQPARAAAGAHLLRRARLHRAVSPEGSTAWPCRPPGRPFRHVAWHGPKGVNLPPARSDSCHSQITLPAAVASGPCDGAADHLLTFHDTLDGGMCSPCMLQVEVIWNVPFRCCVSVNQTTVSHRSCVLGVVFAVSISCSAAVVGG